MLADDEPLLRTEHLTRAVGDRVLVVDVSVRQVEAALALGAAPEVSAAPFPQPSFHASLLPAIDSLRSLGIVWILGLRTCMVLAGTLSVRAPIHQLVTIAMIFASSGLTSLVGIAFTRGGAFSPAMQPVLRSGRAPAR